MDFPLFFGRLHPLVVHLPIGFLLMAILLEWTNRNRQSQGMHQAILYSLGAGAISAILSSCIGWVLANQGDYQDFHLFWHRWLGITTAVLATVAWWTKNQGNQKGFKISMWASGILLLLAGHFGGSLTHGSKYLIQPLTGDGGKDKAFEIPANPDSVVVYSHLIEPVLKSKCLSCHNDEKQNGGLNLASNEGILKGGDNGEIINSKASESELFIRLTLSQNSKKFMPLSGLPLTFYETQLIKWWIDNGASFESRLTEKEVPKEIQTLLLKQYELDTKPKPFVETLKVDPLEENIISDLNETGLQANILAQTNFLINIAMKARGDQVSQDQIQQLLTAKEHITWINFDNAGVEDEMLNTIGQLTNLSRLRLQNNSITDEGIKYLNGLNHLESLNLYNTLITDEALNEIAKMTSLKNLFLWQTKVTPEGVSMLKQALPNTEIDTGMSSQ